ncbi:uncharacterized protein AB675_10292 [Cyphellophora attinorum]|uniref:F-box domain-containing protein n=1 Tax=Cyphellophora attinorum TaxID=1664694 RepID=A0A0N0NK01_9EURO|nr:uncharacterized protein AB675_10292 [Phialophora attinorum]KPI37478.1 hypothetical protein AB675_10292 [Phialophora attinorum]
MMDLPNETIDLILANLDAPSAVCLALTCHRFYQCVLHTTKCARLDDICPKDYNKQSPSILQLYGILPLPHEIPHYRNPFKYSDYARGLNISQERFNPAYVQLMLCVREWMAPKYVFCFASESTGHQQPTSTGTTNSPTMPRITLHMHTAIANQQAYEQRLQGKRLVLRLTNASRLRDIERSLTRLQAILASWEEEERKKRLERERAARRNAVINVRIERPERA